MSESVKDLVVRLSFQHGDTKSQIAAIRNETKLLDSGFQAAAMQAGGFSDAMNQAATRADLLRKKMALQEQAVEKYGQALQQAQQKLQQAQARQADYTSKLDDAKKRHAELTDKIGKLKTAMDASKKATGENTDEYIDMLIQLEDLEGELKATANEIKQWENGLKKSDIAIANADKSIQNLTIAQNQAKASLGGLKSELDGINPKLDAQRAKLEAASKQWKNYADTARNAGEWQTRVGQDLTRGSAMIVTAGVAAAGTAISWQSDFAGVQKTVSGTAAQLKKIEQQLIDMSKVKPVDSNVLAGIAADAGQLGVSTGSVVSFTDTMADLAATTNLTAETGASQFAKFRNITKMQEDQYRNLGSTVVELGNNMATTEADIMNMAMNLGAAGTQIGMTQADILGIAAALSSMGMEAQAGGTAFSRTFVDMQVAVETGSDALKDYANVAGMTVQEFSTLFRQDAAAAVTAFVQGLSNGSQSAIVMLDKMGVTETRLRDALLRSSNASELFTGSIEMANRAWAENVALTNEANVRYGTTASRLTMTGNKAKATAIKFGNDLLPMINKGIDAVDGIIEKFDALDEEQRAQIMTWAAYAAAIGPGILLIGKANKGLGTLAEGFSKLLGASAAAGGGLNGVGAAVKTLLGPAGIAALVVGIGYGVYKFAEWASGAKAAKEATEELMEIAQAMKETQADTIYDGGSADPLARFSLTRDSFSTLARDSEAWMQELTRVWSDGAKESDAIVSQFADSFKAGSDDVRTAIGGRKSLLEGLGTLDSTTQAKMDADLATLESYDQEVAALLKKRQNGLLSDSDQARLNEVIQLRAQLQLEYGGTDMNAYEQILQGMQAEIDRMTARGQGDNADPTLYADSLNALAEGRNAYNESLDASYNAQHAQIMAIQDEATRTQALAALNAQYNQQRLEGEQAYRAAVQEAGAQAWEANGFEEQISQIDQLAALLQSGDLDPSAALDWAKNIDEGALTSMIALVEQLKAAGMSDSDMANLGIDYEDLMSKLTQIRDMTAQIGGDGGQALNSIFSEALPEEIQRIMIGLDMTEAAANWEAFMEGKNPFELSGTLAITEVDETAIDTWKTANAETAIDGPPVKLGDPVLGNNFGTLLQSKYQASMLQVYGADGVPLPVTPEVVESLDSNDILLMGEDGMFHVIVMPDLAEGAGEIPVNIRLNPLDQATITAWETANSTLELTGPTAKLGVGLGSDWQSDITTALDAGLLQLYGEDGKQIPVTAEAVAKLTANDLVAVDEDGTVHAIITPKLGTAEGVETADAAMNSTPLDGTVFSFLSSSAQEDVTAISNTSKEIQNLRTQIDALKASGEIWTEDGLGLGELQSMENSNISYLSKQLQGLSEVDMQAIAGQAANLMAALSSGELDAEGTANAIAQLQTLLDVVSAADQYLGTGNMVSAGIAQGMAEYGWSGDAATVASSIQEAVNSALGVASPATTMVPTGTNTAAGIAQGMTEYSFAAAASSIMASIVGGFSSMNAAGYKIGANFGQGLQNGLRSKMASSLALARSYAAKITAAFQSAWKIHSPSVVAEDLTWNFGRGLEKGMDKWPTVSERMLDQDINRVHGGLARSAQSIDSRTQTYNQQQSVNVDVREMNVRSDTDVEEIAYGVAGLIQTRQRGYGY